MPEVVLWSLQAHTPAHMYNWERILEKLFEAQDVLARFRLMPISEIFIVKNINLAILELD